MNIVLCFPVDDRQVATISAAMPTAKIIVAEQSTIQQDIFEADIFCGHAKVPIDWARVVQCKRLKWIQSSAAGLDHCLVPEVIQSSIEVTSCSGLFSRQVAEHTLALLLGLLRRLPTFFRMQQVQDYRRIFTDEIRKKRVAILGYGGNGRRIAQYLRPMGVEIEATDVFHEHFWDDPNAAVHSPANQELILSRNQIAIVTLPLLETTRNSIGRIQFEAMPRNSYFINVGRGALLDEPALIAAIRADHFAGVGLDVTHDEPLPTDSPLWTFPNVVLTPHVGAQSEFRVPDTVQLFCKNLVRWQANQSLLNWVDKTCGFPHPKNRYESE